MADDVQSLLTTESVPQQIRADAWDIYHNSKDADEFADKVSALPISQETKAKLWDLKHSESIGGSYPGAPENLHAQGPFKTLSDIGEGFGSGVANTAVGGGELARKAAKYVGVPFPETPEFMKKAAAPTQYDDKGNPIEPSTMFKLARGGEQMGEFFVPGGAITDAVSAMAGYGSLARAATKVAAESASAGTITAAQAGGDIKAGKQAALITGALTTPFASVEAALRAIRPSTLYTTKEIVSKIPEHFRGDRLDEIVNQAINDKIQISVGGLKKAEKVELSKQLARDTVVNKYASLPVNFNDVVQPLREFQELARSFGMTDTVNTIDKRIQAIADVHGYQPAVPGTPARTIMSPGGLITPSGGHLTYTIPSTPGTPSVPPTISVAEAQKLKNFGQSLAHDAFGRIHETADTTKIHEVLSEGFMNSLEAVIPEIHGLNRDIQNTKIIKKAIGDYINSNPDLVNTKTAIWAFFNPKAAFTAGLLNNPHVRSSLAIAAHNDVISHLGAVGARIAAGASAPTPQYNPQLPPIPQGPTK